MNLGMSLAETVKFLPYFLPNFSMRQSCGVCASTGICEERHRQAYLAHLVSGEEPQTVASQCAVIFLHTMEQRFSLRVTHLNPLEILHFFLSLPPGWRQEVAGLR